MEHVDTTLTPRSQQAKDESRLQAILREREDKRLQAEATRHSRERWLPYVHCWQQVGIYLLSVAAVTALMTGLVVVVRMDWSHMMGYASDLLRALGMNVTVVHGAEAVEGSTQTAIEQLLPSEGKAFAWLDSWWASLVVALAALHLLIYACAKVRTPE